MNHKTLKNLIVLESNVKIYIPGTIAVNIAHDNSKFVDDTLKLLSNYFGGSTNYQAIGCWQSVNIGLIKENRQLPNIHTGAVSLATRKHSLSQSLYHLEAFTQSPSGD